MEGLNTLDPHNLQANGRGDEAANSTVSSDLVALAEQAFDDYFAMMDEHRQTVSTSIYYLKLMTMYLIKCFQMDKYS